VRLAEPLSISRKLISSALTLAADLNLIAHGSEELAQSRHAFDVRLHDLVARVIMIREIDATPRRETVGVEP
jgi:hypothetical protein